MQHQAKLDEAVEQAKALRKAMKSGTMAAAEIMAANQMGSTLLASHVNMGSRATLGSRPLLGQRQNKRGVGVC